MKHTAAQYVKKAREIRRMSGPIVEYMGAIAGVRPKPHGAIDFYSLVEPGGPGMANCGRPKTSTARQNRNCGQPKTSRARKYRI